MNAAWNLEKWYVVMVEVSVELRKWVHEEALDQNSYEGRTNVTEQEGVDWNVPSTGELVERGAVPP